LSLFPNLDALRAACFPGQAMNVASSSFLQAVGDLISKRVLTRPRKTATTMRHPVSQAGLVLEEDGSAILRAGHALYDHTVGASVSLRPDGSVIVTAPAGLLLSGKIITTDAPTDALVMNGKRLGRVWESTPVATVINEKLLATLYVSAAPGVPATVPLLSVLKSLPLYQPPENTNGL
jgi:hypothetical protein